MRMIRFTVEVCFLCRVSLIGDNWEGETRRQSPGHEASITEKGGLLPKTTSSRTSELPNEDTNVGFVLCAPCQVSVVRGILVNTT